MWVAQETSEVWKALTPRLTSLAKWDLRRLQIWLELAIRLIGMFAGRGASDPVLEALSRLAPQDPSDQRESASPRLIAPRCSCDCGEMS